ncbi:MAG: flagellar motor switch phosphatase FliY [Defluviitaleaceae bacterium]|nr:flagellar motor switch phosphatase FliY [Defluviitaleaceae bacterium]
MGDLLSQEEIDALLGTANKDDDDILGNDANNINNNNDDVYDETKADNNVGFGDVINEELKITETEGGDIPTITPEEADALGEIGNITMGTSATTLYALLGQKVLITTPKVRVIKWDEVAQNYDRPCVGIRVNYIEGVEGSNVLLLRQRDVKVITSLMIGGDGSVGEEEDIELTDLDMSAIGEAMNQMIGSASTSLSSLLVKRKIDIDTPRPFVLDFNDSEFLESLGFKDEYVVCVAFRMEIGTLVDSEIMQLVPFEFAHEMVSVIKNDIQSVPAKSAGVSGGVDKMDNPNNEIKSHSHVMTQFDSNPIAQPSAGYAPPHSGGYMPQHSVSAAPVQFMNFNPADILSHKENIEIIMDVPLEVTVELGRSSKRIREILEFAPGSIIELDKLAGEPIDILVNGKFVAKGEVVVIDENFGIRITSIINADFRI